MRIARRGRQSDQPRKWRLGLRISTRPGVLQVAKTRRWMPEEVLRTLLEVEIAAAMPPTPRTGSKSRHSRLSTPWTSRAWGCARLRCETAVG